MPGVLRSLGCLALVAVVGGGTGGRVAPPSVVEVRVDDGSLVPAVATGWVGPCGLAVTVAHALDGGRGVVVSASDGRLRQAQVVARDDGPDLALLRVNGLRAQAMPLADVGHSPLRIALRRHLSDVHWHRQVGISIDDRRGTHVRAGIEFTPALVAGDSGAPVLDDRGRVVGTAFATNDTVAYASATSELRTLMARAAPTCGSG
jgi:S1-C subfamily serine protease